MIKVTMGNNVGREVRLIEPTTTLRQALEDAAINYSTGVFTLDGSSLMPGDMDKTFADFGITDRCFLLGVAKADNAR